MASAPASTKTGTPPPASSRRSIFPLLVGVLGCCASLSLYLFTSTVEDRRLEDFFQHRAENQMSVFARTSDLYEEILFSLNTLFQSSKEVSRVEFRQAARTLLARHTGIRALEWVALVPAEKRAAVEQQARQEGLPDFQFTERTAQGQMIRAGDRAYYLPVMYIEPLAGNERAMGYDLATAPNRFVLAGARDSGETVASEKFRLVQQTGNQSGLIVAVPVYSPTMPRSTAAERHAALQGYVQGVFDVDRLLEDTIRRVPVQGLDILIVDSQAAPTNRVIGFVSTMPDGAPASVPTEEEMQSGMHYQVTADIGQRNWVFMFRPNAKWSRQHHTPYPLIILSGGLLFSLLLSGYLAARFRRVQIIEEEVTERTLALTEANSRLEKEVRDRQATEQALRRSEASLVAAQRIGRIGSWEADLVQDALHWSAESYRIFGRNPETFSASNRGFFEAVHPEDREKVKQAVADAIRLGNLYRIEHRIVLPDGQIRHVAEQAEVLRDLDGRPVKLVGTVQDITERTRVEEALRRSETGLIEAQRIGRLGSWKIDFKSGRLWWSAEVYRIFGQDSRTFHPTPEAFFASVHPDDRERLQEMEKKALADRRPHHAEHRMIRPDGELRYLAQRAEAEYDAEGNPVLFLGTVQDITERRLTEDALRRSEASLLEAQRIARIGSWEVSLLTGELSWSAEVFRIFGRDSRTFTPTTKAFYEAVHPDDRERIRVQEREALDRRSSYHAEHRIIRPSGVQRFVVEHAEAEYDADGRPVRLVGTVQDITERKLAEDALRQSETTYRTLVETTNTGYLILDEQGRVLDANAEYVLLSGHRSIHEIRGRSVLEWCAPHDIERHRHDIGRMFQTGKVRNAELDYRHPSGVLQPIEINASVVDSEHGRQAIVLVRDISERRRALHEQERLVAILEATSDFVSTAAPDLRILYLNRGGREMLGYTADEFLPYKAIAEVYPAWALNLFLNIGVPAAELEGSWAGESALIHRDGHEIPVSQVIIAHRAEDGTLEYYSTVLRDLTKQRQTELEKRDIERKLQETQKLESLGVLAGGIAHDFNNLLTGILGNASLARMHIPAAVGLEPFLDQIEKASLRAADLCKQMLAYSGKGRFVVQRLDLSALVEDTTHLLQISISKKAVLKLSLATDLPPVLADATQMRQIIMNLVINASEAIGDRSGVIHVSTGVMRSDQAYLAEAHLSPDLPAGDYVFLEVQDNGCGMTRETQARIFDPFFTTKFTGRGLGLAAVLGIVRGHSGALRVESTPGTGSKFRMLLPCAQGVAEAIHLHDRPHTPVWSGKGKVLVVDDEESVRTVTARMLESIGFQTVLAADGREAIAQFRQAPKSFIFVLLDLTMPHMDGAETFRELRRLRPDVRVVLMSGFSEQDAIERFAGEGPAGFIQKPFTAEKLAIRLQAVEEVFRTQTGGV